MGRSAVGIRWIGPALVVALVSGSAGLSEPRATLGTPTIRINEIHYHPPDPAGDAEFVEIVNAGSTSVDVGGWRLTGFSGTPFVFPSPTVLAPGDLVVVAKNTALLQSVTTVAGPLFQWPAGSLSNNSEPVGIIDGGGIIVDQTLYQDDPPWPLAPDGGGPSLELIHPSIDNTLARAWRASGPTHGTPGSVNSAFDPSPIVLSEQPTRGAVIPSLTEITLSFHEPVTGVDAADLTVNGVPATGISGNGAGPYLFTVAPPPLGPVDVVLAPGGIQDLDGDPFDGDAWEYTFSLPTVVFNEIHYHPAPTAVGAGEDPERLQFVELTNAGAMTADLSELALTEGVGFDFPDGTTLAPSEFLVVAQDAAFLASRVTIPPGVQLFTWTVGNLANAGERLALTDSFGNVVDETVYDDEGTWPTAADGDGPSLELVNPLLPNQFGAAWAASAVSNGTPGQANGAFVGNPPPILVDTQHVPSIPSAGQPVAVSVRVLDDGPLPPTVTLFHRLDQASPGGYASTAMHDDGLHLDGAADDGIYGVSLAGLADEQILDFYIEATDGVGTSVAPTGHDVPDVLGNPSRTYLCKFSDELLPTDLPVYHLIVTRANANRQTSLTGDDPDDLKVEFDATFIDEQGNIYYNVTERYRGRTSIFLFPKGYRVEFPIEKPLPSVLGFPVRRLNLNANRPMRQKLGYDFFRSAGLPSPTTAFVRLRYTGINYDVTDIGQNGFYGAYVAVERLDNDYLDSQNGLVMPDRGLTSDGNLYRGHDMANLDWRGTDPEAYRFDPVLADGYEKINNETEDIWDDLIGLVDVLNNSLPEDYGTAVPTVADVDQWALWLAVHNVLVNREGGLYRDRGDDYYVWFEPLATPGAPKAKLLQWDMDSVLLNSTTQTIWRTMTPAVRDFVRHNAFAPIFVKAIRDLVDNQFSSATMDAVIDAMPDAAFGTSGADRKQFFKNFIALRITAINAEIITELTLEGVPASPYASGEPLISLGGTLDQVGTHDVRLNGQPTTFSVWEGNWSSDLSLGIGRNHILVQGFDRLGAENGRAEASVFWEPPECALDLDCDDGSTCTADSCVAGVCVHAPFDEGLACDDGFACTTGDVCLAGECTGTESCPEGQRCDSTDQCSALPLEIEFSDDGIYDGTADTFLSEEEPFTALGFGEDIEWDLSLGQTGLMTASLVRFDDIVGPGPGRIPQGSNVVSATLTLQVFDRSAEPAGSIHEAATDWWEESTTYNSFGPTPGIQPEDIGSFVASAPFALGTARINITSAVQSWINDPQANRGLIILPNATNGAEVRSSEYPVLADRPRLTVEYNPGCVDDGDCNDGNFCTGVESCVAGSCQAGAPVVCDDGIACTVDLCNAGTASCDHLADDGVCGDGLFCNGAEICNPSAGCTAGAPPVVNDGVGCTIDSCDEQNDVVRHQPDDGACDNGAFCDGSETCHVALDCQPGTPPALDDGVGCTLDACDEQNDVVIHTPDDGACDNGAFCDGVETCNQFSDCVPGAPPDPDDGIGCTIDGCDETNDVLTHVPEDSLCDNSLFCDGTESCDPVVDCAAGMPPDVDDGEVCTVDTCDEQNDGSSHELDPEACGAGLTVQFDEKKTVRWDDATGFTSWNLYRGDLSVLITSGAYTQAPGSNALAARECGLVETSAVDLLDPSSGRVAFLLVSGNSATGESGIGTDASGAIRTNTLPCP